MGTIIAIVNQKGGVGKSTTAGALCTGLTRKGYKTLLIEFEPQGNDQFSFKADPKETGLLQDLLQGHDLKNRIEHTAQGDIIAGDLSLSSIDVELYKKYGDSADKLYILKNGIKPLKKEYDFIIIDTPPALNMLSTNALISSDEVIVPTRAEAYGLQGIGQLNKTMKALKGLNKDLHITGILLTMYEGRTALHTSTSASLRSVADMLDTKIFETPIRKCIDIGNAQNERVDIYTYKHSSNAVKDYDAFIEELLDTIKK